MALARVLAAVTVFSLTPLFAQTTEPLSAKLPSAVARKAADVGAQLLSSADCQFLLQVFDAKDSKVSQLGFCFYPLKLERGIFVTTTCVGVLIEPETSTRHPFYGSKGHWGVEGKCEAEALKKKFLDPEIDKTVNPITDLRGKQKEGRTVRLLKDELGIWDVFKARIAPTAGAAAPQEPKNK